MKPNYRLFLEQVQQGLIDLDEAADALEAQAKEIAELKVNNHALKDVVSFEKKRSADYKSLCDQLAAKKDGSIKFDPEAVLELIERMEVAEKDAAKWQAYQKRKQEVIAAGMGRKIMRDLDPYDALPAFYAAMKEKP